MIKDKIRILHVEDNPNDLHTIQQMLSGSEADLIILEQADALAAGLYRLRSESFDLTLLDLGLPDSQGLETLRHFAANAKDTPILVLTGLDDESLEPQALEEGAQDFLIKENISRDLLVRAIRYSIEKWLSERKIRESEAHYRRIVETSNEGIWQMDRNFLTVFVNQKMADMLGYLPGEMLGRPVTDFMIDEDLPDHKVKMSERTSGHEGKYERRFRRKDGSICWTLVSSTALKDDEWRFSGSFGMFADITKRKKAEHALQHERDFAEGIIETAQAIVLVLDVRGCIVRFNKFMEEISGYRLDEVRGKDWFTTFLPERDRDRIKEIFLKATTDIHTGGNVNIIIAKDGHEFKIEWFDKTLKDAQGNTIGLLAVGQDITEKKQAELELERARILLANGARIAHLGSWEYLAATQETIWSEEEFRIYGLAPGSASPSYKDMLRNNVHSGDAALLDKTFRQCLENRTVYEQEHRIIRPDGNIRVLHQRAHPHFDDDGKLVKYVGTSMDITERKAAEDELRFSEELFAKAFRATPNGMIISRMIDGKIVDANDSLCKIYGYTREEILGRSSLALEMFANPSDRQKAIEQITATGQLRDYEIRICRKSGELRHASISAERILINEEPHLITIISDITDRKRADEALHQANMDLKSAIEKATKASAIKSEFLANMSHEIRTPLNGIIGMTGLLIDSNLNAEQREWAKIAYTSSETLLSLVNEILDLSKIEAQKMELETLDFDLLTVLKETSDLMAIDIHEKGLEMDCIVQQQVPRHLRGDPGRLRQILVNLGSNAVKFTASGRISIRICLESEDEKKVRVRFSVSDTGIGIPEDRQDILFTPFGQVDGSTTRKFGGTGLGLIISKNLAELMGGRIGVVSEVGKGSTFWFTAVFDKQSAKKSPSNGIAAEVATLAQIVGIEPAGKIQCMRDASEINEQKIRILVAEDNPVNQKVAKIMLRKMGFRADVVANGKEAIDVLKTCPYDLVLMDCQMPEIDGYEATRRIRQDGSKSLDPRIPIIAMTASVMQSDRERCIQAGMNDFIGKPVQQRELADMIARWLH